VEDNTPPTLTCNGAPDCEDMTIECEFYPPLPVIVAKDDCYEHSAAEYTPSNEQGTCDHDHVETRLWHTHDMCGHTASINQVITYIDHTEPVFEGECEDVTIECTEGVPKPVLTANDNCDYGLEIDYDSDVQEHSCHQFYSETRTWTAHDICGHVASMSQQITIVDNEAPTFNYLPTHTKVQCHMVSHAWPGEITASDNCDYDLSVKFRQERINGTCEDEYTLIRTWEAVDCWQCRFS
jgi:hypothetical protein